MQLLLLLACSPSALDAPQTWGNLGGFDASVSPDGLIAVRDDATVELSLQSWGRGDALAPVAAVEPVSVDGASVGAPEGLATAWRHAGIEEWWTGADTRLEQGFNLDERPAGTGPVTLSLAVRGATVEVRAEGAILRDAAGGVWHYDGLAASDADGRALPAWMEATEDGLALVVDDTGATWPIHVDPFLSTTSALTYSTLGWAWGDFDINADGYADSVVFDIEAENLTCFLGSAAGPTLATTWASWAGPNLRVAPGDVNGDGYDDLVVSDHAAASSAGTLNVFLGGAGGFPATASQVITGTTAGASLGWQLHPLGDLNGDGRDEVLATPLTGSTFSVYYGAPGGLLASPTSFSISGFNVQYLYLGTVASGDFDGDGYDDLAIGDAYNSTSGDRVRLYKGSAFGVVPTVNTLTDPFPTCHSGTCSGSSYGATVQAVRDLTGDGRDELEVGAYLDGNGRSYIHYGTPIGPKSGGFSEFTQSGEILLGSSLSQGDFNGDGCNDLVYSGVDGYEALGSCGRFALSTTASEHLISRSSLPVANGYADSYGYWGVNTRPAGDVNGDGRDDLLLGLPDGWDNYALNWVIAYGTP